MKPVDKKRIGLGITLPLPVTQGPAKQGDDDATPRPSFKQLRPPVHSRDPGSDSEDDAPGGVSLLQQGNIRAPKEASQYKPLTPRSMSDNFMHLETIGKHVPRDRKQLSLDQGIRRLAIDTDVASRSTDSFTRTSPPEWFSSHDRSSSVTSNSSTADAKIRADLIRSGAVDRSGKVHIPAGGVSSIQQPAPKMAAPAGAFGFQQRMFPGNLGESFQNIPFYDAARFTSASTYGVVRISEVSHPDTPILITLIEFRSHM